jgi:3-hydroxy-9,10-secoandrosta-1,3,5(10)-triene-9,17-dione monooxygenase
MSVTVDMATSRVSATTDINLVTAATSLIPTLRSRSAETDALARLPDSTIADLDYYDGLTSRRTAAASHFTEWVEL